MTGGYPAFIFLLLYLLTAVFIMYLIEYIRKKNYHELFRFSGYLAVAGIFTILSGMVVLISVYHLQDAMTRGAGVTLVQALFGAFTPKSFISFILPFASIRNMEYYGTDLSMSNAYFGLLTLVFFLAGLMIRRTKLVNLFLAWGLFCLAASVGERPAGQGIPLSLCPFHEPVPVPCPVQDIFHPEFHHCGRVCL